MILRAGIAWLGYLHRGLLAAWNLIAYSDYTIVFMIVGYGLYCWWVFK